MSMISTPRQRRGFTLIEALVAISIITIAAAGPLYGAAQALKVAQNSRNQLTAAHLAQEGLEYIRKIRDNNFLAVYATANSIYAWSNFKTAVAACLVSAGGCQIDPVVSSLGSCPAGVCQKLYKKSLSGATYYSLDTSGTITPFTRKIEITYVSTDYVKVVSTVTWEFHGLNTIKVVDYLTNWQ